MEIFLSPCWAAGGTAASATCLVRRRSQRRWPDFGERTSISTPEAWPYGDLNLCISLMPGQTEISMLVAWPQWTHTDTNARSLAAQRFQRRRPDTRKSLQEALSQADLNAGGLAAKITWRYPRQKPGKLEIWTSKVGEMAWPQLWNRS
jgi:hypothetical protein